MAISQYDLQRLRQQNVFNPDMSGGTMTMGGMPSMYGEAEPESTYQDQMYIPDARAAQIPAISQQVQAAPSANQDPRDPRNPNRIMEAINAIYTPETQSRDRVNNLLDNAPELQEPSFARRLVAAGAGFHQGDKSAAITQGILNAPNIASMANWSAKTKPFQDAYTTENNANVNERQLAGNAATAEANLLRTEATERSNAEKNRIAEKSNTEKNEAALITARARQLQAEKWVIDTKGDHVWAIAPDGSGRKVDLGANHMSEYDKIMLEIQGKKDVAGIGANAGIERAKIQAGATTGAATIRAGATGTGKTKPMTETERRRQTRDIYDKSPDQSIFVKLPSGVIELGPKPANEGSKLDAWKQANRLLHPAADTNLGLEGSVKDPNYNNYKPSKGSPMSPSAGSSPDMPREAAPPTPTGRIPVYKDGKVVGHIPDTMQQRRMAESQGYTVK